jgi:uncharacterized protein
MKWSIFTFPVEIGDKIIVYNTFNGEVILLERNIYRDILKNNVSTKIINHLRKSEFIVDDSMNEKKKFMELMIKEWNDCGFLGLHILTTTGCNFRCPYCYQSGIDASVLTNEKLDQILEYIEKYVIDNAIKESTLEITGGEPTTNWQVVEKLLKGIDRIFVKYNVKYKTFIVTNGYNLTSEKVDLLEKYNWQRLQVTLDGPAPIHNKRRMLANQGETFDKIINNLEYIIENNKIEKVNLRINYDKSNIEYIPGFLEYIKEKFGTEKIILSLGLITKTVNCSEANKFIEVNGIEESEFFDNYINLYQKAFNLGFKMPDIFSFDGMCTSKLKHGFVIEPNGNITKCVSGVGRKEFLIGNIDDYKTNNTNYLFPELYEECLNKRCPFLPLCHTGCRFESLVTNDDIRKNNCKRKLLERINKKIIGINYGNEAI